MNAILDFYRGEPRPDGLCLVDIWDWSVATLENTHDYIQWMFPLDTPSRANPAAPLLTEDTARAFAWDDVLRDRVHKSLAVMLQFYGLERLVMPRDKVMLIRAATFPQRREVWLQPGNHNHLRLTRIIRSLRLLGLKKDAQALARCLEDIARVEGRDAVSEETAQHWRRAARR